MSQIAGKIIANKSTKSVNVETQLHNTSITINMPNALDEIYASQSENFIFTYLESDIFTTNTRYYGNKDTIVPLEFFIQSPHKFF